MKRIILGVLFVLITAITSNAAILIYSPNGTSVPSAATLNATLNRVDVAGKVVELTSPVTLAVATVVPSGVTLKVRPGAAVTTTGYTLTFAAGSHFDCGRWQAFTGTGNVTFNNGQSEFYPEQWGVSVYQTVALAVTGATNTADTTAILKMFTDISASNNDSSYLNSGGTVRFPSGVIRTGAVDLRGKQNISVKGQGMSSSIWVSAGTVNPFIRRGKSTNVAQAMYSVWEDIHLLGGGSANVILQDDYASWFTLNRVNIEGDDSTVVSYYSYGSLSYTLRDSVIRGGTSYAVDVFGVNATWDTANNITLEQNEIHSAVGTGFRFQGGNTFRMIGGAVEGCGTGGIVVTNTNSTGIGPAALFKGVHLENNGGKDYDIGTGAGFRNIVKIEDGISIGNSSTSTYGLYVAGGTNGATVYVNNHEFVGHITKDIYTTDDAATVTGQLTDVVAGTVTLSSSLRYNTHMVTGAYARQDNYHTAQQTVPLTNSGATPDVTFGQIFYVTNASAQNITNFVGTDGQIIYVTFADINTTVKYNASYIVLNPASDYTSTIHGTLTLMNRSGVWYQIGKV